MNDSFFAYLHRLELIAFFSGYPLIYVTVVSLAGRRQAGNTIKKTITSFLPYSYALVGTLFVGFELKNLYPDYSIDNLKQSFQFPFFTILGLLATLFWIPALAKKPVLSLLHGLVFIALLVNDLFFRETISGEDKSFVSNDMKLYTYSLLLNILSLITVCLIYFLLRWFTAFSKSSRLLR